MRPGDASFGWTVQLASSIGEAPDFNLTSVELFLANDAKALVIERIPAPELVLGT